MAESPVSPLDFQRDFRAVNTPWKRTKDHDVKWSRGARPSAGVKINWTGEAYTGSDKQKELVRPRGKFNAPNLKREHNIVKPRGNWDMPNGRVRNKIYAQKEINDTAISRSLADLSLPTLPRRGLSASDNILYSFDRTDSPGRPVTLDIFVKTTGRDTERLVEKEYEVINANGESLTGKKARRDLRKTHADPGTALGADETIIEDEGFELV